MAQVTLQAVGQKRFGFMGRTATISGPPQGNLFPSLEADMTHRVVLDSPLTVTREGVFVEAVPERRLVLFPGSSADFTPSVVRSGCVWSTSTEGELTRVWPYEFVAGETAYTALSDVATAPFDILVVGDSVGEGTGASALDKRWIDRLQEKLRALYPVTGVPQAQPTYIPSYYSMDVPLDWVIWESPETTAGVTLIDDYGIGGRSVQLNAAGEKITFAGSGTKVQVFYLKSDFFAAEFEIRIDGGAPVTVDCYDLTAIGGVAAAWTSGTLSAGSHTVEVAFKNTRPGNSAFILGAKFYDGDLGKGVHVWDGSHGGWTAYIHQMKNLTHHQLIDPDLLIVALGFNDAAAYGPGEFGAYLWDLVYDLRASAGWDVPTIIVALYNPKAAEAGWQHGVWADYVQDMREAAEALPACDFLDLTPIMPDTWTDPTLYADLVHPNDAGHELIASSITELIAGGSWQRLEFRIWDPNVGQWVATPDPFGAPPGSLS